MPKNATPKPKPDDPEQSKRFVQTAEELGVDERESEIAFERAFGVITQTPRIAADEDDQIETKTKQR